MRARLHQGKLFPPVALVSLLSYSPRQVTMALLLGLFWPHSILVSTALPGHNRMSLTLVPFTGPDLDPRSWTNVLSLSPAGRCPRPRAGAAPAACSLPWSLLQETDHGCQVLSWHPWKNLTPTAEGTAGPCDAPQYTWNPGQVVAPPNDNGHSHRIVN